MRQILAGEKRATGARRANAARRATSATRTLATLLLCTLATLAHAQDYPAKPVKIVVPYPPGGVLDAVVRTLAERLQAAMGQPFIVDNVPGASGNIGLANCGRAPADGYTICVTTNDTISVNPFLFSKLPFDPRELTPVQRLVHIDGVIFASTASGFSNLGDVFNAAAAKPNSVNWGSFGVGSTGHLYMGWLDKEKGIELLHVPYKGSAPLLQAGLSGEIHVGMLASGILMPHIKAGKIKPLAVLGKKRIESLPGVPTVSESGINFYVETWFGMFAPPATPRAIVDRLNAETARILNEPAFRTQTLAPQGFRPATLSPGEFASFLKEDRLIGEKLVKTTAVKLD